MAEAAARRGLAAGLASVGGIALLVLAAASGALADAGGDPAPRPLWLRLLNIGSPLGAAWVALGLLGQLAFASRMLVQWLASERLGRSVVPVVFWWLSLVGASMLLAYFVWRKDVVGVLGQSAGFLVYSRNLWLIHRGRESSVTG